MTTTTTVLDRRYELTERVFSEGNQAAYFARDRAREEEVLLFLVPPRKKLAPDTDKALVADIERAMGVAAPSILPIFDLRVTEDHRFLVMPRPDGENAWTRITARGAKDRIDPTALLAVADDLIAAAKAAHTAQTLLGCSPKQVWIKTSGGAEVQYFWIGRDRGSDEGKGEEAGSALEGAGVEGAYFKAPELGAGGEGAPGPADQYFIAAILYGLLTGEVPRGQLAPIRRSRKDVPPPLAKAIEKALSPQPGARHENLDRFRQALHRQQPKLGFLVPLGLILLGLWAGRSLFKGGADTASWAVVAKASADRETTARAVPDPEVVPAPVADSLPRWAGEYAEGEKATLRIHEDASFEFVDRTREPVFFARGVWWNDPASADALVLREPGSEGRQAVTRRVRVADGKLSLLPTEAGGAERAFAKTAWGRDESGVSLPLLRLDQPQEGALLTSRSVQIVGRVASPRVEVKVGETRVPVVASRFTHVFDAPNRGPAEIRFEAVDPYGFRQSIVRTVVVDEGPPTLEIATASLEEIEGAWQLTVKGSAKDDGRIASLRVNDEPTTLEADGSFLYVRKGADAFAHAFVEAVVVDEVGRTARRLAWPVTPQLAANALEEEVKAARDLLTASRTEEAQRALRDLRKQGGLIEQVPPDEMARLARGGRMPGLSLDAYPEPPEYFKNDGSRSIPLRGSVEWFGPDDVLLVGGAKAEVRDGRFEATIQLPAAGPNQVVLSVLRDGAQVAQREITVWIAAEDGNFPKWTGVPVPEAVRRVSAEHGLPLVVENQDGMRFALIAPGTFMRREKAAAGKPETAFEVEITKPFYMQIAEVSREQFERRSPVKMPGDYPTKSGKAIPLAGARKPALGIPRGAAEDFAKALTDAGVGTYRLPTEAEWEYAARAGDIHGKNNWGSDEAAIPGWANFADKSITTVIPTWPEKMMDSRINDRHPGPWDVGTGKPNAFGLRDMLGNVAEWVGDGSAFYNTADAVDPFASPAGRDGIRRGGGWLHLPAEGDFGLRTRTKVDVEEPWLGFRLVYLPEGR